MSIKLSEFNDVKAYNLSAGKSLPQFLDDAKKKKVSLKYDDDYRRRVELLQDFEFPVGSQRVRIAPDGQHVAAVGVYPPEIRVFDTSQLGMKFARRCDHEVVDFCFLGEDWKKMVHMCGDRTLEFHSQFGLHHKLRIPKVGRCITYDQERCSVIVGGSSSSIYRIDLEEGIFQEPLESPNLEEVHCVGLNPTLPLLALGGDKGILECWDQRDPRKPVSTLHCHLPGDDDVNGQHVRSMGWSDDGMRAVCGLASGVVRVYDVRSRKPLSERDHNNAFPIISAQFHRSRKDGNELVVSADKKAIKFWDSQKAELFTSLESEAEINQVEAYPDSGLFFVACEQPRIGCYFVPALGIAPKWCSFLDSITEELEENPTQSVFDDYQFVSTEQLHQIGADSLIGTTMLQPYMHGFFMDSRLFRKLKSASDPFAYEEYRKKKIMEKIDAKRPMRSVIKKKMGKGVNAELLAKLTADKKDGGRTGASKKAKKSAEKAGDMLGDDRFKKLFSNPDFAIEKLE